MTMRRSASSLEKTDLEEGNQNKCVAWNQAKNQNSNHRKKVTQQRFQM